MNVPIAKPSINPSRTQFLPQVRPQNPGMRSFGYRKPPATISPSIPKGVIQMQPQIQNNDIEKVPSLINAVNATFKRGVYRTGDKNKANMDEGKELPQEKLFTILNRPKVVQCLSETVQSNLLEMSRKILMLPIQDVPKKLIYCDKIPKMSLSNWDELKFIHKIVMILIREFTQRQVENSCFVTQKFIRALINILNSPDSNEQESVNSMIHSILEKCPSCRKILFHEAILKIQNHLQDEKAYFCVSYCLKILHNCLREAPELFSSENDNENKENNNSDSIQSLYEKKILPLYSSYFLSEFYPELNAVSSAFYGMYDQLPTISLRYLLSHWPETNTSKQLIYIQHIAVIGPYLSSNMIKNFLKVIVGRISKCLKSVNFKVVSATLQVISNESFIFLFSSYSETLISYLYPSLVGLRGHWSNEVQNKVGNAIDILKHMNPDFVQKLDSSKLHVELSKTNNKTAGNSWAMIAGAALNKVGDTSMENFKMGLNELNMRDAKENFTIKEIPGESSEKNSSPSVKTETKNDEEYSDDTADEEEYELDKRFG